MPYRPTNFNWNWTDLPANASLADVISTVNWIGYNLENNYTDWIHDNDLGLAGDISTLNTAFNTVNTVIQGINTVIQTLTNKTDRCSYLRGTH